MHDEGRRYRVLGLIGSGGFGRVYRARLEAEGFTKEVAIKVMSEVDPPDDVLHRFRDEARMLGLVRDRAIVAAEPPVRIGGHWAVVMELVDGCTLGRLIGAHGPVPPSVALEIVGEVTRALDKVFHHPGPNGEPLGLLHRDLKPANLQITGHGEVKILDFGVARADMDDREAKTRGLLVGTFDYMAPERLQGLEVPAGDVYSLGRVLEEMLLGRRRVRGEPRVEPADAEEPALRAALQLANEMTRLDPDARPSVRDIEHRCEVLLAATGRNPSLRSWAERTVPEISLHQTEDELVGEVLSESATGHRMAPLGGSDAAAEPTQGDGAASPSGLGGEHVEADAVQHPDPVGGPHPGVPVGGPVASAPARRLAFTAVGAVGLVLVAGVSLVVGMFAASVVTTYVFLGGGEEPPAPEPVAARVSPTDGFQVQAQPGPRTTPVEIPGLAPPSDEPTERGELALVPAGTRADLMLGQGRAAVLELGMRPSAYRMSRGLEVVEAPPYLILGGAAAGRGRLIVEFETTEREWIYDVSRDPALDPVGGPNLREGRERMVLLTGVGAVCTFDAAPRATILMDEARARLEPMGRRGFYLEARESVVDVVFDFVGDAPRVLTLEAVLPPDEPGGPTAVEPVHPTPRGCVVPPSEPMRLPVGGELVLPVGQAVSHLVVGNADAFEVERAQEGKLRVRALRAGHTAVAVTDADGVQAWIRRFVAE